jgi:peptidyl-tRNA hydrolase, PTH1 family
VHGWAEDHHLSFKKHSKLKASLSELPSPFLGIRLALSTEYMNLHGHTVSALQNFFKYAPSEIALIHDELDLTPGTVRLKIQGGHGGHNGLRDIFQQCGSSDFLRIRIGIGRPPADHPKDIADYVLRPPSPTDKKEIQKGIHRLTQVLPLILKNDIAAAMKVLHTEKGEVNHGI